MRVLLTGSHAYGIPSEDSDIDIVFLAETDDDHTLYQLLRTYPSTVDIKTVSEELEYTNLRYGGLNFILCEHKYVFDVWYEGTELLKKYKPVTRDTAVYVLKGLREGTLYLETAEQYLMSKIEKC